MKRYNYFNMFNNETLKQKLIQLWIILSDWNIKAQGIYICFNGFF